MKWMLFWVGLLLIGVGVWLLLPTEASNDGAQPKYFGWGSLLLGFIGLAASHYFKLREARPADQDETREAGKQKPEI